MDIDGVGDMELVTSERIAKLRYSFLGDVLSVQLGHPAEPRLASPTALVTIYVRQDDLSELIGLDIEKFRARFDKQTRDLLSPMLEVELLERITALHDQVRQSPPTEPGAEDLAVALGRRLVVDATLPPSSEPQRAATRQLVESSWAAVERRAELEGEGGEFTYAELLAAAEGLLELVYQWERLRSGLLARTGREPRRIKGREVATGGAAALSAELSRMLREALAKAGTKEVTASGPAGDKKLRDRLLHAGQHGMGIEDLALALHLLRAAGHPMSLAEMLLGLSDPVELRGVPLRRSELLALFGVRSPGEPGQELAATGTHIPGKVLWLATCPSLRAVATAVEEVIDALKRKKWDSYPLMLLERELGDVLIQLPMSGGTGFAGFRRGLLEFERAAGSCAASKSNLKELAPSVMTGMAHWGASLREVGDLLRDT